MIRRLSRSFVKQEGQVEKFLENKNNCDHKIIICGDFNNTSYSWTYRKIKGDFNDSYLSSGSGFGETYPFHKYPLRIDFILTDKRFKINDHRNFNITLSDHEPIIAEINF